MKSQTQRKGSGLRFAWKAYVYYKLDAMNDERQAISNKDSFFFHMTTQSKALIGYRSSLSAHHVQCAVGITLLGKVGGKYLISRELEKSCGSKRIEKVVDLASREKLNILNKERYRILFNIR